MNACGLSSPKKEKRMYKIIFFYWDFNYLVDENQEQLLLHLFELRYYHLELVSHRFQLNELSNEHYLL